MAGARFRGCAPRSSCRCRRRIWRSRRSSGGPATTASSPSWCWRRARRCSAAGTSGRSSRRPRATSCRSRSIPAAQYRMAPSSIGWPSYRSSTIIAEAQAYQAQLLSLIYEGVFGKFPGLKVVLMESGVSWLPAFMWRANKTWKGVRVEVPWVDREPADIMRDHVRAHHAAVRCPARPGRRRPTLIEQIGSDRMLLFATRLSALAVRRRRADAAGPARKHRRAHVRRQSARNLSAPEAAPPERRYTRTIVLE